MASGPRVVNDPLAPAEIAIAELEAEGIYLFDPVVIPVEERDILNVDEILAFNAPPISTLPFLGRPGLVREGAANLLYSYPKTGKTELITAVVKEWASEGRQVFYLTEEPWLLWKERLTTHRMAGLDIRFLNAFGKSFHQALNVIAQEDFDVLVVDTLRNTLGYLEGEGDKEVARVIHPLLRAVQGKTCLCSYHARKMPGEGGRDISGHHSLYGAFDRALQLTMVEGQDTQRRITVSGRCMYDGEKTVSYRMVKPGMFEVLDGGTVVKPKKERQQHLLICLECGDEFKAWRKDAKTCSEACRAARARRARSTESD